MSDLDRVYAEFARRLDNVGQPVIAGGAVRDHLLARPAKDFDFFLLGTQFLEETKATVMSRVSGLEIISPLEFHKSEPYLVVTVRWEGFDVQIMCNPAESLDALVDTFDWNVCLFGYDGSRFVTGECTRNIAPHKQLRLNKITFPLSSLRRGFRFSERFQMQLRREDLLALCKAVVEKRAEAGPDGAVPDMPSLAANALVDNADD